MSKSWDKGSTRQWRRVRAWVLAENRRTNAGMCTLRIAGVCSGEATHVHHIYGRSVTGDSLDGLAATCAACNLHVGEPGGRNPAPKRVSNW